MDQFPRSSTFDPQILQQHNADCVSSQTAILPLPKAVQYTHRPTSHLTVSNQTLKVAGYEPFQMTYLSNSDATLVNNSLYGIATYQSGFEGAVTNHWVHILKSSANSNNSMVVDGGMNTGFYALLTATMGFSAFSFDIQLDCFDVVNTILSKSSEAVQRRANLYFNGLSDKMGSIANVGEGCSPSYNLKAQRAPEQRSTRWERREHRVGVVSLDAFLDQTRNGRDIAILKLDIEGAEIGTLQGLVRHLPAVQNIIMEFAQPFIKRFHTIQNALDQFDRLEKDGFRGYILFPHTIPREKWKDVATVESKGLKLVEKHPVSNKPFNPLDGTTLLWEIVDWQLLLQKACPIGCNLYFHRRHLVSQ